MYEFDKPSYIFMAIEDTDIDAIKNCLITLEGLSANQIEIFNGKSNNKKFNKFNMIADLYIWTSKYWYGTYYDRLTYVRLKKVSCIPFNFTIKYHNEIRLVLKSKFSYIVNGSDSDLLKEVWTKSLRNFDKRRIQVITPGMRKLKEKWDILISNRNPF